MIYLQSKQNKRGEHPVYFRVRTGEGGFTVTTGVSVKREHWSSTKQLIKGSSPLNVKITQLRASIEETLSLYRAELIDYPELKRRCQGKRGTIAELLEEYRKEKSSKTVSAYTVPLAGFSTIASINYSTITKKISEWKSRGLSPTTINTYVRHLVSFRNDAYKRGFVDSPIEKDRSFLHTLESTEESTK